MDQTVSRTGATSQPSARVAWHWWVLATAIGWVVIMTLAGRVGILVGEAVIGNGPVGAVIGMLLGGLILGAAQWLALRPLLAQPTAWVLATVVAVGAAMIIGLLVDAAVPAIAGYGGPVALAIALGVAQWLVLRSVVPRAEIWAVATIVSLLVGFVLFLLVRPVVDLRSVGVGLVIDAVAGLIYGLGTGLAWTWLGQAEAPGVNQQRATP
jgi:hypothetical protein